jgi:hypothetical protein
MLQPSFYIMFEGHLLHSLETRKMFGFVWISASNNASDNFWLFVSYRWGTGFWYFRLTFLAAYETCYTNHTITAYICRRRTLRQTKDTVKGVGYIFWLIKNIACIANFLTLQERLLSSTSRTRLQRIIDIVCEITLYIQRLFITMADHILWTKDDH